MENQICLDKRFSTTRRLYKEHSRETSPTPGVQEGGLRLKGYSKISELECPLVSVITLASNSPAKLEKTIDSILDQTHDNIELIVIGDAAEGPTSDMIRSLDEKIDYWLIQPKGTGIFDSMNKGLESASGDWINFLNAGDTFIEENTVQAVLSTEYERADFIYGHTYFSGNDFVGVLKAREFNILWKKMIFTHQSLFMKRAALRNRKFNTRYKICADYDLIVDLYMTGSNFFNSDIVIASFDPDFSETHCARATFEKWKIIKKYRSDFEFHQYYLRLFVKRFFQDLKHKISPPGKTGTNKFRKRR
jgi:glycosyltransferase involved in cell wall biosynthesis